MLLTRTLVEIDWNEHADAQPAIAYLIAESGIRTMPSSSLTTDNLDDREAPAHAEVRLVWATATSERQKGEPDKSDADEDKTRTVPLETYVTGALGRFLTRIRPGVAPLSYRGTMPGTPAACASIDLMLPRFMVRAGLNSFAPREITTMSIVLWRPNRLITQHGDWDAARQIHGGQTRNLLNDLKLEVDEEDKAFGWIHLKSGPQRVATVPERGFTDRY